jgi:Ala-tRNA(Pro) deacylase
VDAIGQADAERQVYRALDALGIAYERYAHPPVFTVEQAEEHWALIPATHCKNLFLRNQKGSRHYLVVAERSARIDLRRLAEQLHEDKLSFASAERLMRYLGLEAGSVSPFGLLNDIHHDVVVVIERALEAAERVGFHPNVNTATITLGATDFRRFLESRGNVVRWF